MSRDTASAGHGPHRDATKEKFWRVTLRQFAAAGQSVRGFCAERGLSEPSFYAWRRALAERDAATPKTYRRPVRPARKRRKRRKRPAFLPIRLADAAGRPSRIEIVLSSRDRIRLRSPVDRAALIEIVAALRSAGAAGAAEG